MRIPNGDFRLDPDFLEKYKDKQPNWGPLGYLTYKRTYANDLPDGTSEEFWQTTARVIEGMFRVIQGHCENYHLPWSDEKAQAMAQEAYERMFAFKWLPPGRGLSKMGTASMYKVGGACLNNCFSKRTEILLVDRDDKIQVQRLQDCIEQEFVALRLPGGRSVKANVQSFGIQRLQRVTFQPAGMPHSQFHLEYEVTADHRWILENGRSTTALSVGDLVRITPDGFQEGRIDAEEYKKGYQGFSKSFFQQEWGAFLEGLDNRSLDYQRGAVEAWTDTGTSKNLGHLVSA